MTDLSDYCDFTDDNEAQLLRKIGLIDTHLRFEESPTDEVQLKGNDMFENPFQVNENKSASHLPHLFGFNLTPCIEDKTTHQETNQANQDKVSTFNQKSIEDEIAWLEQEL